MDVSQVEAKITPRTKAIIPVHLNGRRVDMDALKSIADSRKIPIVEDAAQAIVSRSPSGYLGTEGAMGCYSLGMTKLISTGQGGLMVTKDAGIQRQLRLARNHGVVDVFEASYTQLGFNGKYNDLAAAFGRAQIRRADHKKNYVTNLYHLYLEVIKELNYIEMIPVDLSGGEVPLWIEVSVADRAKFKDFLNERDIDSRKFLPNLNIAPHLKNEGKFPHSEFFADHGIFLPGGPGQPLSSVARVLEALKEYGRKYPNERIEQFR
jgi:dTDP-4-amino-4,6-dideoxygalactose transaminase